jgi:hypothetical protein
MKGQIYEVRGGYQVRFGRTITKWFRNLGEAERFLTGVRFQVDEGRFDLRDYSANRPMSFEKQAEKYLSYKKKTVKPSSYRNIKNYIGKAKAEWGKTNVKAIGYGEIEDLLADQEVSGKTKHDMCSCLHTFFKWMHNRDVIQNMPRFPRINYELGWRQIIDIETQQKIIDEVGRISAHISPKIVLGIKWLATYVSIRPAEMLSLLEGQIDHRLGCFIIPSPKEKRPKVVPLLDEDIDELRAMPRGLPDLYFFRHDKTANGAKAGQKFGKRMFYKWWIRACNNLGIEGVDLYAGTKHSTVTALGSVLSPEQIRHSTMHASNAAFERYFMGQAKNAKIGYGEARKLQQHFNNVKGHPKVAN